MIQLEVSNVQYICFKCAISLSTTEMCNVIFIDKFCLSLKTLILISYYQYGNVVICY